jgi:hypothetical protein
MATKPVIRRRSIMLGGNIRNVTPGGFSKVFPNGKFRESRTRTTQLRAKEIRIAADAVLSKYESKHGLVPTMSAFERAIVVGATEKSRKN